MKTKPKPSKVDKKAEEAFKRRLANAPKIPDIFKPVGMGIPVGIPDRKKTQYDPHFHALDYVQHCREGNTHTFILACWGVSNKVFRDWVEIYPHFKEQVQIGRTCFQAFWHDKFGRSLISQAKNDKVNVIGFIWWSKNTLGWADSGGDEFRDTNPSDDFSIEYTDTGEKFNGMMEPIKNETETKA